MSTESSHKNCDKGAHYIKDISIMASLLFLLYPHKNNLAGFLIKLQVILNSLVCGFDFLTARRSIGLDLWSICVEFTCSPAWVFL